MRRKRTLYCTALARWYLTVHSLMIGMKHCDFEAAVCGDQSLVAGSHLCPAIIPVPRVDRRSRCQIIQID